MKSHIRPEKIVTSTCHCCRRDGWTRIEPYNLLTLAEYRKMFKGDPFGKLEVKGLPHGFEPMWVGCGGTIGRCIEEAKEYCIKYKVRGAGFIFNEHLVTVEASTDVDKCYRDWWQRAYNETPEESFARR